jgi:hypothetical protein
MPALAPLAPRAARVELATVEDAAMKRLALHRDPLLYAPSYAVLMGTFLSSAVGMATSQSNLVAGTAQIVLGVSLLLTGIHSMVYREEHSELLSGRLGLRYYRPFMFVLIGIGMMLVGLVSATFGYMRLLRR